MATHVLPTSWRGERAQPATTFGVATLYRIGAATAVVAGVLRVVASFVPGGTSLGHELFYGVIDVGLLVALITIYLARAHLIGWAGLTLFGAASIGVASLVGPGPDLTAHGIDHHRAAAFVGLTMFGAAVVLVRARTLTTSAACWLVAPFPALAPDPLGLTIAGTLFGAGFVVAGRALFNDVETRRLPPLEPPRPKQAGQYHPRGNTLLTTGPPPTLYGRRSALASLSSNPVRL